MGGGHLCAGNGCEVLLAKLRTEATKGVRGEEFGEEEQSVDVA
jgi:hypothetical protein